MKLSSIILENNKRKRLELYSVLHRFLCYCTTKKLKKGDILLKAGEINKHMYFVRKGLVRFYLIHNEREYNTWFVKENESLVSFNSFYYNVPSNEYIQALEDTELIIVHKKIYHSVHKIYHWATMVAIDYLEFALSEYQEQCLALRCMSTEEKYDFLMRNKRDLMERISQKHIASYLGVDETYLSKIIAKYKQTLEEQAIIK